MHLETHSGAQSNQSALEDVLMIEVNILPTNILANPGGLLIEARELAQASSPSSIETFHLHNYSSGQTYGHNKAPPSSS